MRLYLPYSARSRFDCSPGLCSRTIVTLNDVKVTDYTEGEPVPEKKFDFEPQRGPRPNYGYIGLQNHSDNDIVFFKEVSVRPLRSAASK